MAEKELTNAEEDEDDDETEHLLVKERRIIIEEANFVRERENIFDIGFLLPVFFLVFFGSVKTDDQLLNIEITTLYFLFFLVSFWK